LPCSKKERELCKAVFEVINRGSFEKDFGLNGGRPLKGVSVQDIMLIFINKHSSNRCFQPQWRRFRGQNRSDKKLVALEADTPARTSRNHNFHHRGTEDTEG